MFHRLVNSQILKLINAEAMKVHFTIICLLVAAFGMIHSGAEDQMGQLVRSALEVTRKSLKKHEPFVVPDMPEQTVQGDDIQLKTKFTNVKISKASDFTIDHIESDEMQMWSKFGVTLPTMHVEGDYVTSGLVKGKHVTGQGTFKLDITKLVTGGNVELKLLDFFFQMRSLNIYYTIEDLKFSTDGLSVEGLTPEQLRDLFSKSFLKYCRDNEKFISSQVSAYVKLKADLIMQGKNLEQLQDWIKKFLDQ